VLNFTCGGCGASWTGLAAAHCSACHRTFAAARLFDDHRSMVGPREHGSCRNPVTITRGGKRIMFWREGMWRGPEMTDEDRARRGWPVKR
jgi:hypothetical protein